MADKPITKELLQELYINQRLGMPEIATMLGYSYPTVRTHLIKHQIPIRSKSEAMRTVNISKEQLEELYLNQGLSPSQIADRLGCTEPPIRQRLVEYGIPVRSASQGCLVRHHAGKIPITKALLEDLYLKQRLPVKDIGDRIGRSGPCVWDYLNKFGIETRPTKEPSENNFFKRWSPEMAWVLGLMFTDGNVSKDLHQATLTSIDREMLEQVALLMGSSLQPRERGGGTIYSLTVGGVAVCKDLTDLGCIPKKSLVIEFPAIPDECVPHFVRGLWDGDGHITIRSRKKARELVCGYVSGSQGFVISLRDTLSKHIGITANVKYKRGVNGCFTLSYYTRQSVSLLEWMYRNSTQETRLRRKYERAFQYLP